MIRKKKVFIKTKFVDAEILITVRADKCAFTKDEREKLLSRLADDAMDSLHKAPYLDAALHKIKVS